MLNCKLDEININMNLLMHIADGSSSQGLSGLQGQTFVNTIGYLKQYLSAHPEQNSPTLSKLLQTVSKFHELAKQIEKFIKGPTSPDVLSQLCADIATQILKLDTTNDELMLPGGWHNMEGPGHGLIYHFKREKNNILRFYIYNAGAGVDYHDKVSSTENERYFSTKVYEFSDNVSQEQLSALVERLVVAMAPTLRDNHFDATRLYLQSIEEMIPHIIDLTCTQPVLASELFDESVTTSGQLSGTCAQRSIHQMLKHYFQTVEIYRRFIIDFKIHAITDYLQQYTKDGRLICSSKIRDLINLAIANTIKICDTNNLFENPNDKITKLETLYALQDRLHHTAVLTSVSTESRIKVAKTSYRYRLKKNGLVPTQKINGNPLFHRHLTAREDVRIVIDDSNQSIVTQLEYLLQHCHEPSKDDPLWVMKQIERACLDLVLPTNFTDPVLPIYQSIVMNQTEYGRCCDVLIELQRIYDSCRQSLLGLKQVTSQNVVQLSLLALQDYLRRYHFKIIKQPSSDAFFAEIIHGFLVKNRWNAYLATHHAVLDTRLVALRSLYQQDHDARTQEGLNQAKNFFRHYNDLLYLYPELFDELERRYERVQPPQLQFRERIAEYQIKALFVLCNEFEKGAPKAGSFLNELQWQPLVTTIQEQLVFHQFVIETLSPFFYSPIRTDKTLKITYNDDSTGVIFNEPLQQLRLRPSFSDRAFEQQYVLADRSLKEALTTDTNPRQYTFDVCKKSSNNIQLLSHGAHQGHVINKDDFFIRDLFHLRTSPDHQINLTLDYFHAARHHLVDEGVQRYVEANVFEAGLLTTILQKDLAFLNRFDRFICSGIDAFVIVNNEIRPEGLFFIRLSMLVSRYAAEDNVKAYGVRLQAELVRLNDLIVTNRDENILAALHHYRFLTLIAMNKQTPLTESLFNQALTSYFKVQAKANLFVPLDVETLFELKEAQRDFQTCIAQQPSELLTKDKIGAIVSGLDPVFAGHQLEGSYPDYTLIDEHGVAEYTVYADLGSVFKQNQKYSSVPSDLFQSNLAKQLGVDAHFSCLLSPDGNVIEFIKSDGNVRLIRMMCDGRYYPQDKFIIEKQLTLHGKTTWYQLRPTTDYQKYALRLETEVLEHSLPEAVVDGETVVWLECNVQNPVFIFTKKDVITHYTDKGVVTTIDGLPLEVIPSWNQFEDNRFVLNVNDKGVSRVSFERYGFSLEAQDSEFVYLPRPSLKLQQQAFLPDMPDVACLLFKETLKEAETTTERDYLIVPVQPFYRDTTVNAHCGELYRFKHDITNHVASQQLKKAWDLADLYNYQRPSWYYKNTCQSILYAIVDGKPVPEKAADGLYLCYLYLACGESEKAWHVLDDLQQRLPLEGNAQELSYLEWIMNGLPVVLGSDDKDATREMPDFSACQLKALSLLTTFLERGKKIQLPCPNDMDTSTANAQSETKAHQCLNEFYNTLTKTVYQRLNSYFATKRHLRQPFYLDQAAQQSLLNYYIAYGSVALGSLAYQQRAESLKILSLELKRLQAAVGHMDTNPTSTDFMPMNREAITARIQQIDDEVAQLQNVMKRTTAVEQVAIDLSLPSVEINYRSLSNKAHEYCGYQSYLRDGWVSSLGMAQSNSPQLAMSVLSPNISQDDFFKYFPDYYRIAKNPRHVDRQALKKFCEQYLIGHRHVTLDKQPTNIPMLVNILYRTCCLISEPTERQLTLSQIAEKLKKYTLEPIFVYQAADIFKEPLQTSKDIFQTMLAQTPNIKPQLSLLAADDALVQFTLKDTINHPAFSAFYDAYQSSETHYEAALKVILNKLPENPTFQALHQAEQQAGKLQYQCLKAQQQTAQQLANEDMRTHLSVIINQEKSHWEAVLNSQLDSILTDANGVFEDPNKACDPTHAQRIQIARRTMQQLALTETDLLNLYYRASESEYQDTTGLSSDKIVALHQAIHNYAQKKVHAQHITRMQKALNDVNCDPCNAVFLQSLASALMSQNLPQARQDPAIMRFQLEEDILLRPRQLQAIQHLLSTPDDNRHQFKEWIEKIIMGGGKSKILLPLLAQKKATGLNLVVIEVPRALLATNHADLNATSQKLFNQTAFVFDFDRDSDSSSKRLTVIYNQLLSVMTQRDYLVTTGESVQSFRLKYIELLYSRPKDRPSAAETAEWYEQVKMASKIVRLFKERADVVIDEVHEGLLLKKKLNYAFGEPDPISQDVIRLNILLYQFIHQLSPLPQYDSLMDEKARVQFNERALRQGWLSIQACFPQQLIEHSASPLKRYVDTLCRSQADKDELILYLQDKAASPLLENCNDKAILDAFAFFKAQQNIAALTLSRRLNENYGPSQQQDSSDESKYRVLAIPYIGNGKANERSRFSNQLETMNYTIQLMLLTGLTRPMLEEIVQQWIMQAGKEKNGFGAFISSDQTKVAQGVCIAYLNKLGITFGQLDVRNTELMERLYQGLRYNDTLIYGVLENHILPQINQERQVLSSNALNHASMYRSKQGVSGTPSNYHSFHQDLNFNPQTSLGTDGYIQELLKNKKTHTQHIPFETLNDFLERTLKADATDNVRAIIDISATFTGYDNVGVASALAQFYQAFAASMQYILYFNSTDKLCAISCRDPKATPIVLNTSDPKEITQKLGCPPNRRFTYYDQSHTVGVDIKQAIGSKALVLVDQRTSLDRFLQGVMRMRGLESQEQEIIIVAQNDLTFNEHLNNMADNEEYQLKNDNFAAALEKIDNLIYDDCLKRVIACDNPEDQAILADTFKSCFINTQQLDLYKQYGAVSGEMDTALVLERYKQQAFAQWEAWLRQIDIIPTSIQMHVMQEKAEGVIEKARPHCHQRVVCKNVHNDDKEHETEKEKQKEEQREKELQQEEEFFNPDFKEKRLISWTEKYLEDFAKGQTTNSSYFSLYVKSLISQLPPGCPLSKNIEITSNYKDVYLNQKAFLSYYLKPMQSILFRKLRSQTITALIISNDELKEIGQWIGNYSNVWVSNPMQTVLCGNRPDEVLGNPEYHKLMEQLCYFGGEMQILTNQETPLTWLSQSPDEKLDYFAQHLMPYRKTRPEDLAMLRSVFANAHVGYSYISEHAFEDLTCIDWDRQYPSLTKQSRQSLKTVATIYYEINRDRQLILVDNALQNILSKHQTLPAAAIACVEQHLNNHRILELFNWLKTASVNSTNPPSVLKDMLGIDFKLLAQTCNDDFNRMQRHILMTCLASPVLNDAIMHIRCMSNHPLLRTTDLNTPLTSEGLILSWLQDSSIMDLSVLEQILQYPQTTKTVEVIFKHALFEKIKWTAKQLQSVLPHCTNTMRFQLSAKITDYYKIKQVLDSLSKPIDETLFVKSIVFHKNSNQFIKVNLLDIKNNRHLLTIIAQECQDINILLMVLEQAGSLNELEFEQLLAADRVDLSCKLTTALINTVNQDNELVRIPKLIEKYPNSLELRSALMEQVHSCDIGLLLMQNMENESLLQDKFKRKWPEVTKQATVLSVTNEPVVVITPLNTVARLLEALRSPDANPVEIWTNFNQKASLSEDDILQLIQELMGNQQINNKQKNQILYEFIQMDACSERIAESVSKDFFESIDSSLCQGMVRFAGNEVVLSAMLNKIDGDSLLFLDLFSYVKSESQAQLWIKKASFPDGQQLISAVWSAQQLSLDLKINLLSDCSFDTVNQALAEEIINNLSENKIGNALILKINAQCRAIQPALPPVSTLFKKPFDDCSTSRAIPTTPTVRESINKPPSAGLNKDVKRLIKQVTDEFTEYLLKLNPTGGVDITHFVSTLEKHCELLMDDKIDFANYKKNCQQTLELNQALFSHALTRKMTVFEHISEGFRALFHVLDKLIKTACGFQQTMAETHTPGARYLVGRNHFFVEPNLETDLGQAVREFKQTLEKLDQSTESTIAHRPNQ